jgi:signal peptidase II
MADAIREDGLSGFRLWSPLAPLMLALASLVFGLDQTHKWWMLSVYDIGSRGAVPLAPYFELVLTWNRGVSYGLFRADQQGWLVALSLGLSLGLWVWACRSRNLLQAGAIALIIGGALSNALDRLVHGAVADFFHFFAGDFSWYVFNLADVAIVAGVGLLLYESFAAKGHRA